MGEAPRDQNLPVRLKAESEDFARIGRDAKSWIEAEIKQTSLMGLWGRCGGRTVSSGQVVAAA